MSDGNDAGRSRRRATKKVDYSKEQEFSDEDVFEDGADSPSPAPTSRRRTTNTNSSGVKGGKDVDFLDEPKYRYTERGYDPSLPHLRERFQFLPEFEADGSPKVELIVGRRPIEEKKVTSSQNEEGQPTPDDDDDHHPDDADSTSSESSVEHVKRRGRPRKKQVKKKKTREASSSATTKPPERHVEYEYLIKLKGKSYLHLEWKAASELESMNKSAKTLFRRFLKKLTQGTEEDLEDPDFDNTYAQPQKIVDEEDHEIFVELTDKELVEYEREQRRNEEAEAADEEEDEEPVQDVKIEGLDDDDKPTNDQDSSNMEQTTAMDQQLQGNAQQGEQVTDDNPENDETGPQEGTIYFFFFFF